MARSSHNYTQLGIGDCGHVVLMWPQVCDLGGNNPMVVCTDCMKQRHQLDDEDELVVWVKLKPGETVGLPKPVRSQRKRTLKPKKLSPWQTLLQQEGLFNGS